MYIIKYFKIYYFDLQNGGDISHGLEIYELTKYSDFATLMNFGGEGLIFYIIHNKFSSLFF